MERRRVPSEDFVGVDKNVINELERQLSVLADEGATEELVQEIEKLLLDNPELQDIYWSWMDVHVVLGVERAAILGEHSASRSLGMLTLDPSRREWFSERTSHRRRNWMIGSLLALSVCVVWAFFAIPAKLTPPVNDGLPGMMASNHAGDESNWRIPQVTRVSWEGPIFASTAMADRPEAMAQVGLVTLELSGGLSSNGYVLRLNPGATAELMLAIDAIAENNCSVIEIDSQGTPTRRIVSFNNFQTDSDSGRRRFGLGGTWLGHNDTNNPQYYLISGIHKLYHPDSPTADTQQSFRLSDTRVILDEPDLIVIGWDDGGLDPSEFHGAIRSDGSFDDLTAVIRIRGPEIPPTPTDTLHHLREWTSPRIVRQPTETPQSDGSDRYRFTLSPGELAVLNVGSEASIMNVLFLIDESSDEVLWSVNNAEILSNHLGAVAVENTSTKVMNLALFGECLPQSVGDDAERKCSELQKIHEQPNCAILGFKERDVRGEFVDLRVTLMTMSRNRNGLFDEH